MHSLDKLADKSRGVRLPRIGESDRMKNNNYNFNTISTHNDKKNENHFSATSEDPKNFNTNLSTGWERILEETSLFDIPSKPKENKKLNLKLSGIHGHKISPISNVQTTKNQSLPEFRNYFPNYKSIEK
jgi:hypothetical protein